MGIVLDYLFSYFFIIYISLQRFAIISLITDIFSFIFLNLVLVVPIKSFSANSNSLDHLGSVSTDSIFLKSGLIF